jgi:hypothetical protein
MAGGRGFGGVAKRGSIEMDAEGALSGLNGNRRGDWRSVFGFGFGHPSELRTAV